MVPSLTPAMEQKLKHFRFSCLQENVIEKRCIENREASNRRNADARRVSTNEQLTKVKKLQKEKTKHRQKHFKENFRSGKNVFGY